MSFLERAINRERSNYPLKDMGIGGFSLFARISERVTLNADNPTFYVEDGTPLNDHRVQKPEVVSISGTVGDVYEAPSTFTNRVQSLSSSVGVVTQYLPRFTASQALQAAQMADQANNQLQDIEGLITRGESFNSIFGNQDIQSKPLGERFIDAMENIHYGNQLISINMPYRVYDNMSITSITIERDNTSNAIEFSIEAVKFRIADLNFVEVKKIVKKPAKAVKSQGESVVEKGKQEGVVATQLDVDQSALLAGLNDFKKIFKEAREND